MRLQKALIPAIAGFFTITVSIPTIQAKEIQSFRPLTSFSIYDGGVAEIVAANPAGNILIYTNSEDKNVGILDIQDPHYPKQLGIIELDGEPTSTAVTPDGKLALVVVQKSIIKENATPELKKGELIFVDLRSQKKIGSIPLGTGPDSIAIGEVNGKTIAVIAIENEPVIVDADGKVLDADEPGNPADISKAGFVQIITLDYSNISASKVQDVPFQKEQLKKAGLLFPADPQPEFVDIYKDKAAVTLQENNGVAIIDLTTGTLRKIFSLGKVGTRKADLIEDDTISFTQNYPDDVTSKNPDAGIRASDAIAWNSRGDVIYTADEGEGNFTGGRGWSAWSPSGEFLWDDGGKLELQAVSRSHYPEGRSENKGIEVEGVETGVFGNHEFAFIGSERGSFVAIYNIDQPEKPQFVQLLATGVAPEGLLAIPNRNLFIASEEVSGTLSIFEGISEKYQPSIMKPRLLAKDGVTQWAAISGLASDHKHENILYGVPDNALPTSIYRFELTGDGLALVSKLAAVTENGKQMRFDLEGIVYDTSIAAKESGGFWLASEGNAKYGKEDYTPNMLIQVDCKGNVLQRVMLPKKIDSAKGGMIRKNGFEGVTISSDGRYLLTAIQRGYSDDKVVSGRKYTRIGRYDLKEKSWKFFLYPMEDTTIKKDWIGLSEIVNIGSDRYAVIERDKQIGGKTQIKAVYTFTLDGVKPFTDLVKGNSQLDGMVIDKKLLLDIRPQFAPYEKIEGLAVSPSGLIWGALDNDGGEVKSVLSALGMLQEISIRLAQ